MFNISIYPLLANALSYAITCVNACSYGWELATVSRVDVEELSSAAEEASDGGDDDSRACVFLRRSPLRAHPSQYDGEDSSLNVEATQPDGNLSYKRYQRASPCTPKHAGLLHTRHRHCAEDYELDRKRTVVS